ncbi:MAG: hypothetical protein WB697_19750, partial [Stellaceae bacterium]
MSRTILRLRFAFLLLRLFSLLLISGELRKNRGLALIFYRIARAAFGLPPRRDGSARRAAVHQVEEDAFAHAAVGDAQQADR